MRSKDTLKRLAKSRVAKTVLVGGIAIVLYKANQKAIVKTQAYRYLPAIALRAMGFTVTETAELKGLEASV